MELPANAKWNNSYHKVAGRKFGLWTVLEYGGIDGRKNSLAICRCECGKTKTVIIGRLLVGDSRSCGCMIGVTHGFSRTPEHQAWKNIIQRTTNKNRLDYARYGGRGIRICDEWRHSFEAFLKHIGPRPSRRHSIERIKNEKNYEPGNVRWATPHEQNNNTRKNVFLTHEGLTMTVAQWARKLNGNPLLIAKRIRDGWSAKDALTKPPRTRKLC